MMTSDTRQFGLSACALKLCVCFISIITLLTSSAAVTLAQTASRPDRGVRPVGSYSVSDIENISLTNGNVNLSIPLASLPPIAGSDLSWTLRAEYSSKLWDKPGIEIFQAPPVPNYTLSILQLGDGGGWRIGRGYSITLHQVNEDYEGIPPENDQDPDWELRGFKWKMMLTTPDGAKHELRPVDFPSYPRGIGNHDYQVGYYKDTPAADSVNATMRYYSFDGSHIWAKIDPFPAFGQPQSWSVYLPDGTIVENSNGIQRIKDTNGNKIKIFQTVDGVGRSTFHFQDELTGREILVGYNPATDTSGVHYQTVGGSWATIEINHGTTRVFGKIYRRGDPCLTEGLIDTEIGVIRSIIYPATKPGVPRLQYTFSYNSDTTDSDSGLRRLDCQPNYQTITGASQGLGSLSQMVTPLGATVEYSYQWDGQDAFDDPDKVPGESISLKRVTHDGITDVWNYSVGLAQGDVKGPDGSITKEYFYSHHPALAASQGGADGRGGLVYRTERILGTSSNPIKQVTVERHWAKLIFSGGNDVTPGGLVGFNTVVDAEYTTLHDSNGAPTKMSAKTFQHDYNGNVTQITEYDWFDPNLVSRDAAGVPTGVPNHPSVKVLRTTTNTYYNQATTSDSPNVYAKRTLPDGAPLILNALQQTTVGDSQTLFSYDNQPHGAPPTSGNLTKESRWGNINGQWLDTTYTYDSFGNRTSVTDPRGHVTQIFYEDATHANQTKVVVNPGTSPATEQATTMIYDYHTGALLSSTDPNNQTIDTDYINQLLGTPDPYLRPGVVTGPPVTSYVNGASYTNQRRKVKTTYDDNARQVIVESDLNTSGDYKLKIRTTTDQLGRAILAEKNEDGASNYTISNQTIYVQMGKITLTSNPKRSGATPSDGWTRATRDELGRVIEVATFSGANQPPDTETTSNWTGSVTTSYNANQTTVTDQAGKRRRSETDALGRLIKVTEDPGGLNYDTHYSYDALGNLRLVTQGSQTRTFAYDSLSRLISATNPESGTITYAYDPNGNLIEKTDARGVGTTMTYDALNRARSKVYAGTTPEGTAAANATPPVNYFYDDYSTLPSGAPTWSGTPSKGRLIGVTYGSGSEGTYYKYDAAGKIVTNHQRQGTSNYATTYNYNLAGAVTLEARGNPARRRNPMTYDEAGRLSVMGTTAYPFTSGSNLVRDISYTPFGALQSEIYGSGLIHSMGYNARLQPTEIRLGRPDNLESVFTIYYIFGTAYNVNGQDAEITLAHNNGNIARIKYSVSGTLQYTQTFQYDPVNRLRYAVEQNNGVYNDGARAWYQTFDYDRYGNRGINVANMSDNADAANSALQLADFSEANNRVTRAGFVYDAAGNLIAEPGKSYTYDAENRIVTATVVGVGTSQYFYDGNGRRVKKIVGGVATRFEYGAGGELVAERNDSTGAVTKEYFYKGGELLATTKAGGGYEYATADHLGTPRAWTDHSSGNLIAGGRHDYLPFGEELFADYGTRTTDQGYATSTQADGQRKQFTNKERDSETGLDYFGERYYASTQGRFTSCDPLMASAKTGNPQSWNRFVYVLNNPLRYVDPDGMKEKEAWDQLSEEEKNIIAIKLVPIKDGKNVTKADLGAAGKAFNSLFNGLSAEQIEAGVTGFKNFIDGAGGHSNSAIWQQINRIEKFWLKENNGVGIAFHVKNTADFLKVLEASKQYEVNHLYEKVNFHGEHINSARMITERSTQTALHLVQQKGYTTRWDAHWDKLNVAFSKAFIPGPPPIGSRDKEMLNAVRDHIFGTPISPKQVRQQIKERGIVPRNEP